MDTIEIERYGGRVRVSPMSLEGLAALRRMTGASKPTPPPRPAVESPYLTAREAAAYLGLAYGTFRNIAKDIRRAKTGRYHRDELDRYATGKKR